MHGFTTRFEVWFELCRPKRLSDGTPTDLFPEDYDVFFPAPGSGEAAKAILTDPFTFPLVLLGACPLPDIPCEVSESIPF